MLWARVRPGFSYGYAKQYKAGDIVEITEGELRAFSDKLERLSETEAAELEEETTTGAAETPAPIPPPEPVRPHRRRGRPSKHDQN